MQVYEPDTWGLVVQDRQLYENVKETGEHYLSFEKWWPEDGLSKSF